MNIDYISDLYDLRDLDHAWPLGSVWRVLSVTCLPEDICVACFYRSSCAQDTHRGRKRSRRSAAGIMVCPKLVVEHFVRCDVHFQPVLWIVLVQRFFVLAVVPPFPSAFRPSAFYTLWLSSLWSARPTMEAALFGHFLFCSSDRTSKRLIKNQSVDGVRCDTAPSSNQKQCTPLQ